MKNTAKIRFIIGIFFSFIIVFPLFAQTKDYVLVLNSIHVEDTWSDYFNLELKKNFKQKDVLDLKTYTLSLPLIKDESEIEQIHKNILDTYNAVPPVAVIILGDPAWIVVTPLFEKEWKDIPVILCYSRSRIPRSVRVLLDKEPLTPENSIAIDDFNKKYNVTVLENPFYLEETVDLMRKLQPQLQKLAFVSDDRYISVYVRKELTELMERRYPYLKLEFLTGNELNIEQLFEKLDSYGPEVGILFFSWIKSPQEYKNFYWARHFNRCLSATVHSPIYTVDDVNPENGSFVGGYYISVKDFTESCMAVLERILAGEKASSIPRSAGGNPRAYLNYMELQWFNINPSLYPSDAYYYNRPKTFLERNKALVYACVIFLCVCLLLKFWYDWRNRKRKYLNRRIINALNYPVYWVDKNGIIEKRLNNPGQSYIVLNTKVAKNFSVRHAFINSEEYTEYIRLVNLVIHTKQTQETVVSVKDYRGNIRYLSLRIVYYNSFKTLVFVLDISEKEKEKRESEEYRFFLETILDNLPIPAVVKDMKDDGRFIIWNKQLSEIIGIQASEIKGKTLSELPEHMKKIVDFGTVEPSLPKNKPVSFLKEMECADGSKKVMSIYDILISYKESKCWLVGSAIDVTELEMRKKELEMLNQQYDLILRAIGAMPWTWDVKTGILQCDRTYVSHKYGITKSLIGKTEQEHYDQIAPEHRERIRTAFNKLYTGELQIINEEYPVYYSEYDSYLWVESFVVVSQKDAAGRPLMYVGATTVIDERKKLETELFRAKEKAEESNKLKSAFLANMSHEIRTPLNAIVGFSALLAEMNKSSESSQYIQIIENNNRVLLQLINDVLDLSKIESGMMEFVYGNVDINASLSCLVSSWVMRMPDGVQILFDPALEECRLNTEENRLMQVISNYVSNAAKHTESGTITVGYYPPQNGNIRFFVRDTGVGIPSDKLSMVFDRFVKLDSFKQGTGLGLSICQMIAEYMKGKVGVESELGKGSEFWFEIPYQPAI